MYLFYIKVNQLNYQTLNTEFLSKTDQTLSKLIKFCCFMIDHLMTISSNQIYVIIILHIAPT